MMYTLYTSMKKYIIQKKYTFYIIYIFFIFQNQYLLWPILVSLFLFFIMHIDTIVMVFFITP